MSDTTENTPRGPGRPRNADRPPQHLSATDTREPIHDTAHEKPRVRTRQRRATADDNPFNLPLDEIPEGSTYEWKRFSNVGQEDPFYLAAQRKQGWEPVDPRKHPTWIPPGYSQPYILRDGLILMERPVELTNEARAEIRQLSRQQVIEAEQRLGMGPKDTLTRDHDGVRPKIVKEIGRMVPIED